MIKRNIFTFLIAVILLLMNILLTSAYDFCSEGNCRIQEIIVNAELTKNNEINFEEIIGLIHHFDVANNSPTNYTFLIPSNDSVFKPEIQVHEEINKKEFNKVYEFTENNCDGQFIFYNYTGLIKICSYPQKNIRFRIRGIILSKRTLDIQQNCSTPEANFTLNNGFLLRLKYAPYPYYFSGLAKTADGIDFTPKKEEETCKQLNESVPDLAPTELTAYRYSNGFYCQGIIPAQNERIIREKYLGIETNLGGTDRDAIERLELKNLTALTKENIQTTIEANKLAPTNLNMSENMVKATNMTASATGILAILTGVLAFISVWQARQLVNQQRNEKKRRHFEEMKRLVLQPWHDALFLKVDSVDLIVFYKEKDKNMDMRLFNVDMYLFNDIDSHFPALKSKWEKIVLRCQTYHNHFMKLHEEIFKKLREKKDFEITEWAAKTAYKKIIGETFDESEFFIAANILRYQDKILAKAENEEKLKELKNEILKFKSFKEIALEVHKEKQNIDAEFKELEEQLKEVIHSQELKGHCKLF